MAVFTVIYVGIFGLMLADWAFVAALVLPIFLATAALHFGADWHETIELLFKSALGLAPLCAIGVSNLRDVELIFAAMANPELVRQATRIFILVASVTVLVAGLALAVIGRSGARARAAVFAKMLASLFFLPPVIGFALYFCAFHTPRHPSDIRGRAGHFGSF